MALPLTSKLRLLDVSVNPIGAPTEWTPALIEVSVGLDSWESTALWRQGEILPIYLKRVGGQLRVLADWPRSGPGNYLLRLSIHGHTEEHTVTVLPNKIDPVSYAKMLEDLQTRLPGAVALGLQRTGALADTKILPPNQDTLAQEVYRLRRAILGTEGRPGLQQILREISSNTHHVLTSFERSVRPEQVRRPHPVRLIGALVNAHNLDQEGRPKRVPDMRSEHSVNIYENRLVKTYVHQVQLRLRRLSGVLEATSSLEILSEVKNLEKQLYSAQRQAAFLENVDLLTVLPTHISMVLLKRAPYRLALEGFLEFHRTTAVRLNEPALEAPLERTDYLYQLWGTLNIIVALLEVANQAGFRTVRQRLVARDAGGIFIRVLPRGDTAIDLVHPERRTTIKLIPERTYSTHAPLRSVTFLQRPDVAIEIYDADNKVRIYIFDPKYKLDSQTMPSGEDNSKAQKVDIDKMHSYRDAIRDAQNNRVVQYAAILYPGPHIFFDSGIAALRSYPGEETTLQAQLQDILRDAVSPPSITQLAVEQNGVSSLP